MLPTRSFLLLPPALPPPPSEWLSVGLLIFISILSSDLTAQLSCPRFTRREGRSTAPLPRCLGTSPTARGSGSHAGPCPGGRVLRTGWVEWQRFSGELIPRLCV